MDRKEEQEAKVNKNGAEVTEVVICGHTESDAIHPRFHKASKEVTEEYQREHHYYCSLCRAYFAPTVLGLREHFRVGRIDHIPIASCIYCTGPVYNYSIDNKIKIYHECNDR